MSNSYPHMCRDEHVEIGHSDSESEMCPMCTVLAALAESARREAELRSSLKALRFGLGELGSY